MGRSTALPWGISSLCIWALVCTARDVSRGQEGGGAVCSLGTGRQCGTGLHGLAKNWLHGGTQRWRHANESLVTQHTQKALTGRTGGRRRGRRCSAAAPQSLRALLTSMLLPLPAAAGV